MLPWKLRKRHILLVSQIFHQYIFHLASFVYGGDYAFHMYLIRGTKGLLSDLSPNSSTNESQSEFLV